LPQAGRNGRQPPVIAGGKEEVRCILPVEDEVRMLGRPTFELQPPAVDEYGPNQIPIFQIPQRRNASRADLLAEVPVAPRKNKCALNNTARGTLGRRKEGFDALVCHAPTELETRKSKMENGNNESDISASGDFFLFSSFYFPVSIFQFLFSSFYFPVSIFYFRISLFLL
jgi:hypothetical protein